MKLLETIDHNALLFVVLMYRWHTFMCKGDRKQIMASIVCVNYMLLWIKKYAHSKRTLELLLCSGGKSRKYQNIHSATVANDGL